MRQRIVEALARLLEDRSMEDVSVTAICSTAGISRQTFYTYFRDKYEIVQWHYDQICVTRLDQAGRTMTWEEANLANIRETHRWRRLYQAAFSTSKGYHNITAYGRRHLKAHLTSVVNEKCTEDQRDLLAFQIDFFAYASGDMFARWGREERHSPEEFAAMLDSCMPRELLAVLNFGL